MPANTKLLTKLTNASVQGRMTHQGMMLLASKLGVWDESFLFMRKMEAWEIIKSKCSDEQIEDTMAKMVQPFIGKSCRRVLELEEMGSLGKCIDNKDAKALHHTIKSLIKLKEAEQDIARFLGISVQLLGKTLDLSVNRMESHQRLWKILDFFGLKLKLVIVKSQEGN